MIINHLIYKFIFVLKQLMDAGKTLNFRLKNKYFINKVFVSF